MPKCKHSKYAEFELDIKETGWCMKNFCVPGDNTNHSFSLDSDPEMQKKDKTQ